MNNKIMDIKTNFDERKQQTLESTEKSNLKWYVQLFRYMGVCYLYAKYWTDNQLLEAMTNDMASDMTNDNGQKTNDMARNP